MRVIIRADGGTNIGMGHIMRTLVLANNLSKYSEIIYVLKDKAEFQKGIDYITNKGFKVVKANEEKVIDELKKLEADLLITDSYDVDENYFDRTKEIFPYTGYIDDLNKIKFNVDFIINQNVYAKDLSYRANENTKYFLGTEYALLREEFTSLPKREVRKEVKDILITLGGADPANLTKEIAITLSRLFPKVNLHVVIGPSFIYRDEIEILKKNKVNTYVEPEMSDLMLRCDIAVSACGSTLYELAACGIPAIGIITADNQVKLANKMNELGSIKKAERIYNIGKIIRELSYGKRLTMADMGKRLVDGQGGKRLAEALYGMISDDNY